MFHQVWYQGGVKATVSGVVEDLKFKISEESDQNWCFPESTWLAVYLKPWFLIKSGNYIVPCPSTPLLNSVMGHFDKINQEGGECIQAQK